MGRLACFLSFFITGEMGPRQEAPCLEAQSYYRPAFPPSRWEVAVNEKQLCLCSTARGPSQGPRGSFNGDTDNLSPIQERLRKDNGGTKLSQGGSGQHPSMPVSAFTVPDYIG